MPSLVADAWHKRDKLREVSTVQFQLRDFFPRYDAREIRGLRLHLGNALAGYQDFGVSRTHRQGDINARLLTNVELHAFSLEGLESRSRNTDVVGTGTKA